MKAERPAGRPLQLSKRDDGGWDQCGGKGDEEEEWVLENTSGSRIHRASIGLDVGVLSLGRGSSLNEVGALSKEHTPSSVLGRASSPTREPKGVGSGLGALGSEEWSGVEKGRAPRESLSLVRSSRRSV